MAAKSFGRYKLLEPLGQGAMGEVYRAYDATTERIVALKLLPAECGKDPLFQRRFRSELQTAAELENPHVVPIYDYGEIDDVLYVAMRFIEGRDLGKMIADAGGRLSAASAVAIIEQVAAALDTAHRADLVHRDVKPSNILVTKRDFAYLVDFGIARATAEAAATNTGQIGGTLAYVAPERFTGTSDTRSDVYALACVLYECLTGVRPFPGDTSEEQMAGHLTELPPQPSTAYPDIPPAFDPVIAKGMAKDPEDRYQSATELATAARAALTSTYRGAPWATRQAPTLRAPLPDRAAVPSSGAIASSPKRAAQARRRRVVVITGAAIVVAVAIVAGVVMAVVSHKDRANTRSTLTSTTVASATPPAGTTTTQLESQQMPPFQPSANLGANCQYPATGYAPARPVKPPRAGKTPTTPATADITMATSQGEIDLTLARNESPCTVNSFVSLVTQGFFNNTKCHRLSTDPALSVLQCGDPTGDSTGGPGYGFANEYPTDQYRSNDPKLQAAVIYPRGTVAMANSGQPNSNGSQFFLVYKDSQLPPQYTVFGTIDPDTLAVLDKIAAAGVVGGGTDGTPVADVTVTSVVLG